MDQPNDRNEFEEDDPQGLFPGWTQEEQDHFESGIDSPPGLMTLALFIVFCAMVTGAALAAVWIFGRV